MPGQLLPFLLPLIPGHVAEEREGLSEVVKLRPGDDDVVSRGDDFEAVALQAFEREAQFPRGITFAEIDLGFHTGRDGMHDGQLRPGHRPQVTL